MSALWKSIGCAVVAASLIMPAPVFANSLRLASKGGAQEQTAQESDAGGEVSEALKSAEAAQQAAEAANKAAEEAQKSAEEKQSDAARRAAEAARQAADEAGSSAEDAQKAADAAKKAGESGRADAAKKAAEEAAQAAEKAQSAAQKAQSSANDAAQAEEGEPLVLPSEKDDAQSGKADASDGSDAKNAADEADAQKGADAKSAEGAQAAAEDAAKQAALDAVTGLRPGDKRSDVKGEPLVIPEGAEDASFLAGDWSFDRMFVRPDGGRLRADFSFDGNGRGVAAFTDDKNVRHTAEAAASMSDGVLKIQTTPYTNPESSQVYYPEFMECENSDGAALCRGTDGFSAWEGERLMGEPSKKASSSRADKAASAGGAKKSAARQSAGQSASSGAGAQQYAELSSGGAELPPVVMEQAEKARATSGSDPVSALEGDWRFSRDLARKSDGQSVALEFHFDKNGRGYSVIRDGSGKDFKADAEAGSMPDGSLRVKTDAYDNGSGQGYYPTFMECRKGASSELMCDVSNGWTRVEDGQLVSKDSLDQQERQLNMEELLPVAPETPGAASADKAASSAQADSGQAAGGNVDIAGMLAQLSDNSAAASSKMSAAAESRSAASKASSSKSASSSSSRGSALSLPPKDDTMSFLEGHWRCNTGLARVTDNQPVVVEFRFDKNGKGTAAVRELSGRRYDASAHATYKKGVLRINTSDFRAKDNRSGYHKSYIECYDQGGQALCNGKNGGISWYGASFIRLK